MIHSFKKFKATEDGILCIISAIQLYRNDSILVFCRSNDQVKQLYQGIADYYGYNYDDDDKASEETPSGDDNHIEKMINILV